MLFQSFLSLARRLIFWVASRTILSVSSGEYVRMRHSISEENRSIFFLFSGLKYFVEYPGIMIPSFPSSMISFIAKSSRLIGTHLYANASKNTYQKVSKNVGMKYAWACLKSSRTSDLGIRGRKRIFSGSNPETSVHSSWVTNVKRTWGLLSVTRFATSNAISPPFLLK